ncbi:MAG: IPT/TIG domain-containing protein [Anaerolineae bacterium]|nr:IPT/TIG domain-containing protein [Anaerolineae bacterium]
MKNRFARFSFALIVPMIALFATFWFAKTTRANAVGDLSSPSATPIVTAIIPNTAPNDLDTPVVISGTGFAVGCTVTLGSNVLADVGWASENTISATIPWGVEPGIYSLKVENPDGGSGTLPNAFTVTQGIGVWTTGGPYGGFVQLVVLHPTNPSQLYVTVGGSGLYSSSDAGEHWQPVFLDPTPTRLAIDPHQPNVMYIGANNVAGTCHVRSEDGGITWEPSVPPVGCVAEYKPFVHPTISGTVYLTAYGLTGAGVFKSTDRGQNWITMTKGLTDVNVYGLAFHPLNPDIMILTTVNGNVFASTDGGEQWNFAAHLARWLGYVYFNPFGAHEAWAVAQMPASGPGYGVFRSKDAGFTTWEHVTTPSESVHTLTFHPAISGTLWIATDYAYVSTDGGQTWDQVTGLPGWTDFTHGVLNFAVDASADPANPTLYAATGKGLYKSVDGGAVWFESQQGLSGVSPYALAVSPHDVDEVYASTNSRGVLRSNSGGRSWQALDVPSPGWAANLAVDPSTPTRVYFSCQQDDQPCVRISDDRGESWVTVPLTLPERLDGWWGRTHVVAPHPTQPGRVLAGTGFYPVGGGWVGPQGGLYLSQDYGEHWEMIQPTVPISHVAVIVYDPVDPQIVYAGTRGGTLLKSTDGGTTWQPLYSWSDLSDIVTIAIHPTNPNMILVGLTESGLGIPGGENGIFCSTDGGHSWELAGPWVFVLAYDAHDPPLLYYGSFSHGLRRSADNGQTWEVVAGMSVGSIGALATTSDGERVIVYVGVTGGAVTQPGLMSLDAGDSTTLLGSGVFRLTTILSPPRLFLPLVVKGE